MNFFVKSTAGAGEGTSIRDSYSGKWVVVIMGFKYADTKRRNYIRMW